MRSAPDTSTSTETAAPPATGDPSARLEAAFRVASHRLRGLSIANPALDVEAVGFAPWEGRWLGVMVTPSSINLMLVPDDPAAWRSLVPGAKRRYRFPAGEYEFIGAHDPDIGEFQVCSLFSPVHEFADHATARLVAQIAREALFDAANAEPTKVEAANERTAPAPNASSDACALGLAGEIEGPLAQVEAVLATPVSRHDLLHGRLSGSHRDDRG